MQQVAPDLPFLRLAKPKQSACGVAERMHDNEVPIGLIDSLRQSEI